MKQLRICLLPLFCLVGAGLFADTINSDLTVNGKSTLNGSVRVNTNGNEQFFLRIDGGYPITSTSGANYRGQIYTERSEFRIPAGVVDNGYRIGLTVNGFVGSSDFQGHLAQQTGAWIRAGHYNHYSAGDPTGSIDNVYALRLENLNTGSVNVGNTFGVYQESAHARNYFAGDVGIGTSSPLGRLHVKLPNIMEAPNAPAVRDIVFEAFRGGGTDPAWTTDTGGGIRLSLTHESVGGRGAYFQTRSEGAYSRHVGIEFGTSYEYGGADSKMYLSGAGNLGVGTMNPTNKLEVNGTIRSKEVVVESTGWPDYVFEDGYELPTLAEVESHIEEKGYLPGVEPASTVNERGQSLGAMQRQVMRKVEELTLYVLELKRENDSIRKEKDKQIAELRREIQQLRKIEK